MNISSIDTGANIFGRSFSYPCVGTDYERERLVKPFVTATSGEHVVREVVQLRWVFLHTLKDILWAIKSAGMLLESARTASTQKNRIFFF